MISLDNVSKAFGKVKAVDDVSFKVLEPGIVVIMGSSGSGKTTLLRLIAGLEAPDSGQIYLNEKLTNRKDWLLAPHRRDIGFVFQVPALWPHMTVAENILFSLSNISVEEKKKRLRTILEKLDLFGLERRFPDEISGGQARRVALARSVIARPKYLLLDEPLTNVDMDLKKRLLDFIKNEVSATTPYLIYVTHDIEEAKSLSQRSLFMDAGKIK
jgi:iron(III) transport system ATP-binding protein